MYNRRNFIKLSTGILTTAMFAMSGCGANLSNLSGQASVPPFIRSTARSASLRVATPGAPINFDPALFSIIEEHQLGFALFDGLVWVDATLTPQPMLAEAWEATKNLDSWTFKLREDVIFHHGTPLTAQDVVYSFMRILDLATKSSFRNTLSFVDSVESVDDYTVRFLLKSPSADLPILLGAPQARIVAHDYDPKLLNKHPSGTGPFQFAQNLPRDRVQLTRNADYWQEDQPQLEAVEFIVMPYTEQIGALQRDDIDMMMQVGMADVEDLAKDPALSIGKVASGAYQPIVMRATVKPFRDNRVREALKYCMDRQSFQQQQLQQHVEIGNDQPVANISAFHADLPVRPYDPDKARSLLTDAGYGKGLSLDLITSTVRPGMTELAQAFQEMAKPAGVSIDVVLAPAQVYWSDYAGRVPFHMGNWGLRPSIDETFMVAYHSLSQGNEAHWSNATLDGLLDQARGEPDQQTRQDLYHQAQQLIMEDGAVIIPYFLPSVMAKRANVTGFTPHPSGWLDLRTTGFE